MVVSIASFDSSLFQNLIIGSTTVTSPTVANFPNLAPVTKSWNSCRCEMHQLVHQLGHVCFGSLGLSVAIGDFCWSLLLNHTILITQSPCFTSVVAAILRIVRELHQILRTRLRCKSGLGIPVCVALPLLLYGLRCTRNIHLCIYVLSTVESSRSGFWLSLFGNSWRQLCIRNKSSVAARGSWWNTRASRQAGDPKALPQSISQVQDHWTGWQATFLMQLTLNTPPVFPTNNMLLRSNNPTKIPVSHRSSYVLLCRVAAICMYTTASPSGGNFRRCGVSQRNSYAVLLPLTALWDLSRTCAAYP